MEGSGGTPDVVGFDVEEARRRLASASVAVAAVVPTGDSPPTQPQPHPQPQRWRVVRQLMTAGGAELVVTRQVGRTPADFLLLGPETGDKDG